MMKSIFLAFPLIALVSLANAQSTCTFEVNDLDSRNLELITQCATNNKEYQNYLGNLYRTGERVSQDYNQAVNWYKKSAENGYASAMFNLGNMYRLGIGVAVDSKIALEWYEQAAKLGDPDSQTNYGYMLSLIPDSSRDLVEAYAWMHSAYLHGNDRAFVNRSVIADEMTLQQVEQAEKLGERYYQLYHNVE